MRGRKNWTKTDFLVDNITTKIFYKEPNSVLSAEKKHYLLFYSSSQAWSNMHGAERLLSAQSWPVSLLHGHNSGHLDMKTLYFANWFFFPPLTKNVANYVLFSYMYASLDWFHHIRILGFDC